MQYKFLLAMLGLALIAGTAGAALAHGDDGDQWQPLVSKLAARFNLKEADVQAVFDEAATDHIAHMDKKFSDRLDEAVADGKLTEAQKQLITEKQAELKKGFESRREEFKDMTPEQHKEAMRQHREDLEAWATANNIDLEYLLPGRMGGRHHGPGGGHHGFGQRHMAD